MTNVFTHKLNINDPPIILWKGKSFNQISSMITYNKGNSSTILSARQLRKALPLKIYRREIANNDIKKMVNHGSRISYSIDNLNMPGSTIVNSHSNLGALNSTVDFNYVNNTTEHPGQCINECIASPAENARRRVRSAGMIIRKYNVNKNNDTYCTGTAQYLKSRNLSFAENQYNYLRQGYASLKPGSPNTATNIYSTGGISHCYEPTISQALGNNIIQYYWYKGADTQSPSIWNAVIPDDVYTIENLNTAFKNAMFNNGTYITNSTTLAQVYPLNIAFDNLSGQIILQSFNLNAYTGANPTYYDAATQTPLSTFITTQSPYFLPYFIIPSGMSSIIGFNPQSYIPSNNQSANYQIESNRTPTISSNYVRLNYKPNNSKFAVQGAVSSSALILRKKYDNITTTANLLRTSFGSACANAMAYGVSENPYTLKTQIGFPLTKTPVIKKDGTIRCAQDNVICSGLNTRG